MHDEGFKRTPQRSQSDIAAGQRVAGNGMQSAGAGLEFARQQGGEDLAAGLVYFTSEVRRAPAHVVP